MPTSSRLGYPEGAFADEPRANVNLSITSGLGDRRRAIEAELAAGVLHGDTEEALGDMLSRPLQISAPSRYLGIFDTGEEDGDQTVINMRDSSGRSHGIARWQGLGVSAEGAADAVRALASSLESMRPRDLVYSLDPDERADAVAHGLSGYAGYRAYPAGAADAMHARSESLERFISDLMRIGQRSARREGWPLGRSATDPHQIRDSDVRRAGQSLFSRVNDPVARACFFIGYGPRRAVVASASNGTSGQVVIVRTGQGHNAPQASRLVTAEALDAVTGEMVFRYLAGRRNREVGE